ncbi:hypothetical protein ABT297_26655 [Dactylosporangium sp. NPDC000555]|uniref:hypothetical protein n=1 Tax=Dactylosporangium sp. NPDC000555 TaxID=3154260 RepID=UPI0033339D4B
MALTFVGALPPAAAVAQPTPTPETTSSAPSHHDMLKGVLHGEGIVQTTNGPVRVAMQRGAATNVTPTSVTVHSSDGFTRAWTLNNSVRVYDKRHTLEPSALKTGAQVSVAGTAPVSGGQPGGSPAAAAFTAKWILVQSS